MDEGEGDSGVFVGSFGGEGRETPSLRNPPSLSEGSSRSSVDEEEHMRAKAEEAGLGVRQERKRKGVLRNFGF